jgi:hypothetical protein
MNTNSTLRKTRSHLQKIRFSMLLLSSIVVIALLVIYALAQLAPHYHQRMPMDGQYTEKWLLSNVNIIDFNVSGNVLWSQDILVDNGIIHEIVPHGSKSFEVMVIDASGKYVTPGLIDAHVHIEDSAYLGLALSYGVTTVRGMRGHYAQLQWRSELESRKWLGSRFYVASPIIDEDSNDPFHTVVDSIEEAEELVSRYVNEGYDLIKIYGTLNGDIYDTLVATAQREGVPIAKHGPNPATNRGFSSLQYLQSVEHIEDIYSKLLNYSLDDPLALNATLRKVASIDVPVVSTLSVFEELTLISQKKNAYIGSLPLTYFNEAHLQLINVFGVERWLAVSQEEADRNAQDFDNLKTILGKLNQLNTPLVLGSDSGALLGVAGYSTHNELRLLIESGLSNKEALLAATANAAKMLGIENKVGTVRPHYEADFIVSDENPLHNVKTLQAPHAVAFRGVYLDKPTLNELKTNAQNTLPIWLTYPMLTWQMMREFYASGF